MTMERWIERQLRRLRFGRLLHTAAPWWAGFLFAFGSAVLVVKVLLPGLWPHVLWLAGGILPATLIAWGLARRGAFDRTEAVALLDRKLRAGGLLMTLAETPDPRWQERLPQGEHLWRDSLPRWWPVHLARRLALPSLFAMGAFLVPLRDANPARATPRTVAPQAARELAEMLDVLDEAAVLEPEEQQKLRREIEQLAEETRQAPLTHEKWETVDALRQRLQMRLNTAELSVAKARNALAMLADAGGSDGPLLSAEQSEQLRQDVLETLRKMAETGAFSQASAGLNDELQRLVNSGELKLPADPGQQQGLMQQLQGFLDREAERLTQLRGKGRGGASEGALAEAPGFNQSRGNPRDGEQRGRGGSRRGGGDAALTFGEESRELKEKFKEVVLPPGFLENEKSSQALGTSLAPPAETAGESAPRGTVRETAAASGGETWNRRLRPRHRNVIRKYFDSE